MVAQLAVEHLQPKDGPHGRPDVEGRWENYLLACVNCNSTKGAKRVVFEDLLFPDRDNTFAALTYQADGTLEPAPGLSEPLGKMVSETLKLTGLDQAATEARDENGRLIALDRIAQRLEIWLVAADAKSDISAGPADEPLRRQVIRTA